MAAPVGASSLALLLLTGAGVMPALDEDLPSVDPHVRSYVISNLFVATPDDKGACSSISPSAEDIYYQSLPAEERAKIPPEQAGRMMSRALGFKAGGTGLATDEWLKTPFTEAQLAALRTKLGIPAGKGAISFLGTRFAYDSCTDPDDFPMLDKGNVTHQGKVADGFNLDGKVGPEDYVSADGSKGIDNNLLRATGCTFAGQDFGNPKVALKTIASAAVPTLIQLRGVDSMTKDDDVQVDIYPSANPLKMNASGGPLAWATFDADPDPKFHIRVRGRIENGVLITDKADMRFRTKEQIIDSYREVLGARVRIKFQPDGNIEGSVYGYHTIASIAQIYAQSTNVGQGLAKMSCPAIMGAVKRMADGYPDPKNGKMTAISSALMFAGAPAFVTLRGGEQRVAEAQQSGNRK